MIYHEGRFYPEAADYQRMYDEQAARARRAHAEAERLTGKMRADKLRLADTLRSSCETIRREAKRRGWTLEGSLPARSGRKVPEEDGPIEGQITIDELLKKR
jgi:hypothetical protein